MRLVDEGRASYIELTPDEFYRLRRAGELPPEGASLEELIFWRKLSGADSPETKALTKTAFELARTAYGLGACNGGEIALFGVEARIAADKDAKPIA